jgi:Fe-S cluster assembly scaffold protein SufB
MFRTEFWNKKVLVKESLFLNGESSRGLAKSRIVSTARRVAEVFGEAVGNAPNAHGHVDCVEIIKGKYARVSAVPKLIAAGDGARLARS